MVYLTNKRSACIIHKIWFKQAGTVANLAASYDSTLFPFRIRGNFIRDKSSEQSWSNFNAFDPCRGSHIKQWVLYVHWRFICSTPDHFAPLWSLITSNMLDLMRRCTSAFQSPRSLFYIYPWFSVVLYCHVHCTEYTISYYECLTSIYWLNGILVLLHCNVFNKLQTIVAAVIVW